ncbi:MAG: hypothetical protein IPH06_00010 [Alphaproteobacteria bacterium]|nr:hypothetical protein [Alphaproteobacteria bacterium]
MTNVSAPINGTATNLASSITYLPYGPLSGLTYGNTKNLRPATIRLPPDQ